MEEDIKIINKDGEMKKITIPLPKNLELSHNQRIEKINGKWYKVTYPEGSKIMEEDIRILTAFLLANIPEIITQEEFNEVKQAIENLINRNKELEEENEEYKADNKYLDERVQFLEARRTDIIHKFQNEITDTTIPKSKVREFFEKSKVVKNESKDKTYLLIDVSELNEELLQEGDDK